jgi:hypothetical protein
VFKYKDQVGGADVIFGEEGDSTLLGAFTLEALALALDPLKRELRPLPMILARCSPSELPDPCRPSDWSLQAGLPAPARLSISGDASGIQGLPRAAGNYNLCPRARGGREPGLSAPGLA